MLARQDHAARATPLQWQGSRNFLAPLPLKQQAGVINELVNAYRYIDDISNWGAEDYWQTPEEFYRRGGGDCEDFAIAKYEWLRALGVPEDNLRLMVVQDTVRGIPHSVLLVNTGTETLVLDNQEKTIRAAQTITRYEPIYSINRQAWYLPESARRGIVTAAGKWGEFHGAAAGT
jgi:predicted transglutaminase-like cysteine proteinase